VRLYECESGVRMCACVYVCNSVWVGVSGVCAYACVQASEARVRLCVCVVCVNV